MKIQFLEWDTNFFGVKTGKLEIHDESNFDPLVFRQRSIEEKYKLVYVFSYGKMLPWGKAITASIELMDIMLTMSMKFNKSQYIGMPHTLRNELLPNELSDCYQIAEQISVVSRFYNEFKVGPKKTQALYKKWIDNALNQSFADGIFVVKHVDAVVGIHIIRTDTDSRIGKCSVIGTDSTYKGKGTGKNLWNQSFGYWANHKEIDTCQVPFSILNNESFNFHLKIGFNKIEQVKYIYHFRSIN